jgi:hypothetical protein
MLIISVFVHRYRDVDPNIRKDCIQEVGSWVETLPDIYMNPSVLRYLGWMLSDKVIIVKCPDNIECDRANDCSAWLGQVDESSREH